MTKQQTPADLDDLLKNADKYLGLVIKFFKGMQGHVEDVKAQTNVDSTWAAATDDVVKGVPENEPEAEKLDAFDIYIEMLERRAYEHGRRGEVNAAAAIRRIINELRELDELDA